MISTPYKGRALQFISINSFNKIVIHPEALSFIDTLTPPLSIMTVVGPSRSGKSLLFSHIINENLSNQGDKVNLSKGLVLWTKPILATDSEGKVGSVIVVDSHGFQIQETEEDQKILAFCLLLSNSIIFNSKGPIDAGSLQYLQKITGLAKQFSQNQPISLDLQFNWVLRDFTIKSGQFSISNSAKQYMENSLISKQNHNFQVMLQYFKKIFPERTCHSLSTPKLEGSDQNPAFLEQIIELRKILKGQYSYCVNGSLLISLLEVVVDGLNNGSTFRKIYLEAKNCMVRLNCMSYLHDQLKKIALREKLNNGEEISDYIREIRMKINEEYKQNISSQGQLDILNSYIEQNLKDFEQKTEIVYFNFHNMHGRSRTPSRLSFPRQQKMVRLSFRADESEKDLSEDNYIQSINRINTTKTILSKFEEYETKLFRYQLEVNSSKHEFDTLKHECDASRKEFQDKTEKLENELLMAQMKEKQLLNTISELNQSIIKLKEEKMIVTSEISCVNMLNQEKISYLQKQIQQLSIFLGKQRLQKEQKYKQKLNEYIQQIEQLKKSHQEQIIQLKSIYKTSNQKLTESLTSRHNETFYTDFQQQLIQIQRIKEENERLLYKKSQLQNNLKIANHKLQLREEQFREQADVADKRFKETQRSIEKIYETKLQCKENIILQLQKKIHEMAKLEQIQECSKNSQLQQITKSYQQIEIQLQSKLMQNDQLANDTAKLKRKIYELQCELNNYESKVQIDNQKRSELQFLIKKQDIEMIGFKQEMMLMKNRYKDDLDYKNQLIDQLNAKLEEDSREIKSLSEEYEKNMSKITLKLESEKDKNKHYQQELNKANERYRKLQRTIEQSSEQMNSKDNLLQQILAQKQKVIEHSEYKNTELNQEITLKGEKIIELEDKIKQLELNNIKITESYKQKIIQVQMKNSQNRQEILSNLTKLMLQLESTKHLLEKQQRGKKVMEQENQQKINKLTAKIQEIQVQFKKQRLRLEQKIKAQRQAQLSLENQKFSQQNQIVSLQNARKEKDIENQQSISDYQDRLSEINLQLEKQQKQSKKQLDNLLKQIRILKKERQVAMSNIQQLQSASKNEKKRYQSHLSLYDHTVRQLRKENETKEQLIGEYEQACQRFKNIQKMTDQNYERDIILWSNKISICEQKISELKQRQVLAQFDIKL